MVDAASGADRTLTGPGDNANQVAWSPDGSRIAFADFETIWVVDASDGRMQNKIRLAQEQKVPYMLVLGDREVEARAAAPRTRGGEQMPAEGWEELAARLAREAAARRPD